LTITRLSLVKQTTFALIRLNPEANIRITQSKNYFWNMITISLHGAEFFAFHGFYPEEQKLGSKFVVDVDVQFEPLDDVKNDEITNTVDYEKVYEIVEAQMKRTAKLIETVGQSIAEEIKAQFYFADNIRVSIKKLNPPLKGRVEYSNIVITL
jgi:dihydroneopterin aldolase